MFHKKAPEKWLKLGLRDVCLKKNKTKNKNPNYERLTIYIFSS